MTHVSLISEPRIASRAPSAETPRPMSFAILRNTHEAFRTSIRLQQEALRLGDTTRFRAEWQAFKRALAVHVAMEDHTMFALLDWAVGWVVRLLSDFGSTAQPPHVATRVFAWGLQNACSRSQWHRLRPIVQRNCTPAIWAEMASKFGLDGEGAVA